jgi:hypothetical protein
MCVRAVICREGGTPSSAAGRRRLPARRPPSPTPRHNGFFLDEKEFCCNKTLSDFASMPTAALPHRRMKASNKKWRSPHLLVNDALMLYESFKGLVELLDSVRLSYLRASASHLLSQRLAHRCICIASSRATVSCPYICAGVCRMF